MTVDYPVDVLEPDSDQDTVLNSQERVSLDPELADRVGLEVGDQFRLTRNEDQYAIYTYYEDNEEGDDNDDVNMGKEGRYKLDDQGDEIFDIWLDTEITRSCLRDGTGDAPNEAWYNSEFVERLDDPGGSQFCVIAPHGGMIEKNTDEEAEGIRDGLASHNSSAWRAKGWKQGGGAFDRWHITSADISFNSFPMLAELEGRAFEYVVGLHGFSDAGVLIGGLASDSLKQDVKSELENQLPSKYHSDIRIAGDNEANNGDDPDNIMNRLAGTGQKTIQLEQSWDIRDKEWPNVAQAIVNVFDPLL